MSNSSTVGLLAAKELAINALVLSGWTDTRDAAIAILQKELEAKYIEPIDNFEEGQWWVKELDSLAKNFNLSNDQKRAIAVVHNMLKTIAVMAELKKKTK